jgi:hypothetical protein
MAEQKAYLNFSERYGEVPIPPPLNPGKLPYEIRNQKALKQQESSLQILKRLCNTPTLPFSSFLNTFIMLYLILIPQGNRHDRSWDINSHRTYIIHQKTT